MFAATKLVSVDNNSDKDTASRRNIWSQCAAARCSSAHNDQRTIDSANCNEKKVRARALDAEHLMQNTRLAPRSHQLGSVTADTKVIEPNASRPEAAYWMGFQQDDRAQVIAHGGMTKLLVCLIRPVRTNMSCFCALPKR